MIPPKCTDQEGGSKAPLPGHGSRTPEQRLDDWRNGRDVYGLWYWFHSRTKAGLCGVDHTLRSPLKGP